MCQINTILSRLNKFTGKNIDFPEVMTYSFYQLAELAKDTLTWEEIDFLYQQSIKELGKNKMAELRILSRANPQLQNAIRLAIRPTPMMGSYNDLFPPRALSFVNSDSVASMFSPAAYLTELYREAKPLHPDTSEFNLDSRRPDFASITLSQLNLDDEISTLALSNELLIDKTMSHCKKKYDETMEMLSVYRQTVDTPYHQPYQVSRQSIILRDPKLEAFNRNPAVATLVSSTRLLGIHADVSPELNLILTETIESDSAQLDAQIKKNFGDEFIGLFLNSEYLAHWYGLSYDELNEVLFYVGGPDYSLENQTNDNEFKKSLLKFNKFIRLYKATGVNVKEIINVVESDNEYKKITPAVLERFFFVNYYSDHYGIDIPTTLVLAGANIGQIDSPGQDSLFTRLFNTPMLDNKQFTADNNETINLQPSENNKNTFTKSVIKRAFGVNDAELYTLTLLSTGSATGNLSCSVSNLSTLYRIKLLADVHGLTVRELDALLALLVPPFDAKPIGSIPQQEFSELVSYIDRLTQWLTDMGWTVSELHLMLTDNFSDTLTPAIENLVATLKNGLTNQVSEAESITAAAPFIAAATQLDSVETAQAVLQWLSQLKPEELTVTGFLNLVNKDARTDTETQKMVVYCQVMGQLALIVRYNGLSAGELLWVVSHPSIFEKNTTLLAHNIDTLYKLTQLHALLARCGQYSAEILTSLSGNDASEKNNLSVNTLATALSLDEQALAQALAQCSGHPYFYCWTDLSAALEWLDVATILAITPANVAYLTELLDVTKEVSYEQWTTGGRFLQAGLDMEQTTQLNATLEEKLSMATSRYVIKNCSPQWVVSRDTLYSWLLIDNQVSAQIKTTRIAEAIAGVQLYVNRALSGQESGVVSTEKSKAFFSDDWDTYNKRYSTWAGVSRLVYFPENYIDPTLRIGQTSMMDEMLQSLSQGPLTRDTVEDAFKTYMTRFEEIANLDITSGYHDSIIQDGTTYLIGKSAIGDYYWRSADIRLLSDGKLPANAWREWKKITVGMTPENNLIRPVIFQSRLYIVWVESKELAEMKGSEFTEISVDYELKYAHIQHDGTWSSPISIALDKISLLSDGGIDDIDGAGMYCANNFGLDMLYICFYLKKDSTPTIIYGINLFPDGVVKDIPKDDMVMMSGYVRSQFDTVDEVRLNTPYAGGNDEVTYIPSSFYSFTGRGDNGYTSLKFKIIDGSCFFKDPKNKKMFTFSFDAKVSIRYFGGETKGQIDLFNKIGKMDDVFEVPFITERTDYSYISRHDYNCIMMHDGANYKIAIDPASGTYLRGEFVYAGQSDNSLNELQNDFPLDIFLPYCKILGNNLFTKDILKNDRKNNTYVFSGLNIANNLFPPEIELKFSEFKTLYTKINLEDVTISAENETISVFHPDDKTEYSLNSSIFIFRNKEIDIPLNQFGDKETLSINFITNAVPSDKLDFRKSLGRSIGGVKLFRQITENMVVIPLRQTSKGAQYLQYGNDRIRVNTLFARQLIERANLGINAVLSMDTQYLPEPSIQSDKEGSLPEPMDFNGANAIYFWEMFYYVPMMVFKRLLIENKFTEATQWIKYVWSPDGYLTNGQPASYTWNVRPLEDEISWHSDQLDSVDPDAVAQADPMHYKLATFMSWLDLLIARGDMAYRQLERDALNEAKMWYVQALDMLGGEPYATHDVDWKNPSLKEAASKTVQNERQTAMIIVRQQMASGELRTANSLTELFLPQTNEKLTAYWQTLAQRLHNLRHNLSIEGNPLSLSLYAQPANPAALLSAAVNTYSGSQDFPPAVMPLYRFPVILDSARNIVNQLSQFGSSLLSLSVSQDAEAMTELLQTQGAELMLQSIALKNTTLHEIDEDKATLEERLRGAKSRLDSYTTLYDEDVSAGEKESMALAHSAFVLSTTSTVSYTVAAALDSLPNIYGFACGGAQYGSISRAVGHGTEIGAGANRAAAENISQAEIYRRRRQEWKIQRDAAQSDVAQIRAQLAVLAVRREGAMLQKVYLETQQSQTQVQMMFLQNKFTSKALYSWLRGKLSAIYYQYYDLAVSRCLMAEEAYKWATGADSTSFIRPGVWQGTYAGLMAGETLMLNLTQMEQSWLQKDQREKEVVRTVCLSEVYAGLPSGAFNLVEKITAFVEAGKGSAGVPNTNSLSVTENDKQLHAKLKLSDLKINDDYPSALGSYRNIKQISVTLPALVGPYQDVRAVLSYGGSIVMPGGCNALAVSHGMNDSGQFRLDFNDSRLLPFEGIPVNDNGTLTLSFPQIDGRQKALLLSLADIILHIRYTIFL